MLHCLTAMPLSVALNYAQDSRAEIVCLHRSVISRVDLNAELDGESRVVLPLIKFSSARGVLVVAAVRAIADEREFNSVLVIENGKVLGVSDQLFASHGLSSGDCIRCFDTTRGRLGVIISDDMRRPQLWHALSKAKCDFALAFDEKVYDSSRDNAFLQCMAYCCGISVYAHFCDQSLRFDCYGKCAQSECGLSRRMTFAAHKKAPTFFNGTIKVYVERP